MTWTPVEEWYSEQPQECSVCGWVLAGRDLGYIPAMCEQDACPGLPTRSEPVLVRRATEHRDCEHGYRAAGGSYHCPACEGDDVAA